MVCPNEFHPKLRNQKIKKNPKNKQQKKKRKALHPYISLGRDFFVSVVAEKVLLLHDKAGKSRITSMHGEVDSYK